MTAIIERKCQLDKVQRTPRITMMQSLSETIPTIDHRHGVVQMVGDQGQAGPGSQNWSNFSRPDPSLFDSFKC